MKKLGVKKVIGLGLGVSLLACSALSHAAVVAHNVKIKNIFQVGTGAGYVYIDIYREIQNDCGNLQRVAFAGDEPSADFYKAMALTALTTGKTTYMVLDVGAGECVNGQMHLNDFGIMGED